MDALLFHPKVVHLPMALGLLMPLVSAGLWLAWWRAWLPWRSWFLAVALQALLVGSGFVVLQTGETEEERVEQVVPERVIEVHERAAEAFVWASAGALVAMLVAASRGTRRFGLSTAGVATLGTLVVLGLGYRTGQAGGSLVYEHGAAQAFQGQRPPADARAVQPDDDD